MSEHGIRHAPLSSPTHPRTRFVPNKKSTIESEPSSPTSTEKDCHSPCRPDFSCKNKDDMCFRTKTETENMDEDRFNFCYTDPGGTPLQEHASIPNNCHAVEVETQRLRFAILAGGSSGPSSPRYDKWNYGYKNVFHEQLRSPAIWTQLEKRKRAWNTCESGCYWCDQ